MDWGNGCVISDAIVGVTIDAGASSTDITNVTVENASASGFRLSEDVTLIGDTVVGIVSGYGIEVYECDPVIKDCYVEACDYGIYLRGSSGTLRGNTIAGSGSYGVYLVTDPEDQGADTLTFVDNSVTGYFSGAHLYAGNKAHCDIDSCEFVTDASGTQSPYGIKAGTLAWVKLRHSLIKDYDTAGFYSDESVANLGEKLDWGNNSIYNTACGSTCYAYSVVHIPDFGFGPMGPGGGPFGPPPLKAERNWWGDDAPDSSLFSGPATSNRG